MKVIFEDDSQSEISILFKTAYPEHISNKFIYAGGDRGLINEIEEAFKDEEFLNSKEKLYVFIDLVPDNIETVELYNHIFAVSSIKYPERIIILPIPCAEYYFIKSIHEECLILDKKLVNLCIDKINYKSGINVSDKITEKHYKSFEKFCKEVKEHAFRGCIRYTRGKNSFYLNYACKVLCKSKYYDKGNCKEISLLNKSIELLKQYPFVPAGANYEYRVPISDEEAKKISMRELENILYFENELIKQGYISSKNIWRKIKC